MQVHRSHDVEGAGLYFVTLMSRSNTVFSFKCISKTVGHSSFKLCRCIAHMMLRVLGQFSCNLDSKVKVNGKKAGICDGVPSTAV